MKILHYALFYSSKAVTNYLYARDIDPNTILLNDYAFMERVIYITVSNSQIFIWILASINSIMAQNFTKLSPVQIDNFKIV